MQNDQISKAIPWNPWHGCHRCSPGCQNCFVFKQDKRYNRDTNVVTKNKSTYYFPDSKCPPGSVVKLCFSSDLFLEEADEWRSEIWDAIRRRKDCTFVSTTKRPERIKECLPSDWGDGAGWENFHLSVSVENQEMADKRVQALIEAPIAHREVFCSPLIAPITLFTHLNTGLIKCVNVGGEMAPRDEVRPTQWEWVRDLYLEAQQCGVEFYFHQSGNMLMRGSYNLGTWNLSTQNSCAESVQHELEEMYGAIR